jgi:hypothetical protein
MIEISYITLFIFAVILILFIITVFKMSKDYNELSIKYRYSKMRRINERKIEDKIFDNKMLLLEIGSIANKLLLPEYELKDFEILSKTEITVDSEIYDTIIKLKSVDIDVEKFRIGKEVYKQVDKKDYEVDYQIYERSY